MKIVSILLLHLWILASQTFYMYLSNKEQVKKHFYLYLIAIPIATAFPVILNGQEPRSYALYEYSIVFCIIFTAVVDASLAAFDREYLTDSSCRTLIVSFFMICAAAAFYGSTGMAVRAITAFLFAGSFIVLSLVKKHSAIELMKSLPLTLLSILCAWTFIRFGL